MTSIFGLFDTYSLRARLQPAFLALSPIVMALLSIHPAFLEPANVALLFVGAFGTAYFIGQVVGDHGRSQEGQLFKPDPSTIMLRHKDTEISATRKQRYHKALSEALGTPMPTEAEEGACETLSDKRYDEACAYLRAVSRDVNAFQLLFVDSINYGFRRNLLALKPVALVGSFVSLLLIFLTCRLGWPVEISNTETPALCASVIILNQGAVAIVVSRDWVQSSAKQYAKRLLEVADHLPKKANVG